MRTCFAHFNTAPRLEKQIMDSASRPPQSLIARAAAMRIGGQSWETIAVEIDCSCDYLRFWPLFYRLDWNDACDAALARIAAEAAAEAWQTLRRLLRSRNESVALVAARDILNACLKFGYRPGLKSGRGVPRALRPNFP
jgi:hypothetical protein